MVLDTRKNLNSGKFEQVSGDTLNLSGSTYVYKDIVVKSSGDLTLEKYSGTTNKMVEVDSEGMVKAVIPIIAGKLSDPIAISLLVNSDNWDVNGVYIGPSIIDTYEGQYYKNSEYYYFAYDDNDWIRLLRG